MVVRVVHLVDDTTAGGVMQVIKTLTDETHGHGFKGHVFHPVKRGALPPMTLAADIIVSHLAVSWRTLPMLLALRVRYAQRPLIHVEHSYTEGFVKHCVRNKPRFYRLLKTAYRLFNRVVAVSEAQKGWLLGAGLVRRQNLRLIRSYTDMSPALSVPPRKGLVTRFAAIGRLERQKGFDDLITAFRQNPRGDVRLTIYGTGSEEQRLKTLAAGDTRIHFAGHTPHPHLALAAAEAVIMPSRWEAYGLVALETLCAGRVLICSDVDGLRDHAVRGAKIVNHLGPETFNWPAIASPAQRARQKLGQSLKRENKDAWEAIFNECLCQRAQLEKQTEGAVV